MHVYLYVTPEDLYYKMVIGAHDAVITIENGSQYYTLVTPLGLI